MQERFGKQQDALLRTVAATREDAFRTEQQDDRDLATARRMSRTIGDQTIMGRQKQEETEKWQEHRLRTSSLAQTIRRILRDRYSNRQDLVFLWRFMTGWSGKKDDRGVCAGTLGPAEFKKMLNKVGLNASDEEARYLIASVDKEGRGAMRYEELVTLVYSRFYDVVPGRDQAVEKFAGATLRNLSGTLLMDRIPKIANALKLEDPDASSYVNRNQFNRAVAKAIPGIAEPALDWLWNAQFDQMTQETDQELASLRAAGESGETGYTWSNDKRRLNWMSFVEDIEKFAHYHRPTTPVHLEGSSPIKRLVDNLKPWVKDVRLHCSELITTGLDVTNIKDVALKSFSFNEAVRDRAELCRDRLRCRLPSNKLRKRFGDRQFMQREELISLINEEVKKLPGGIPKKDLSLVNTVKMFAPIDARKRFVTPFLEEEDKEKDFEERQPTLQQPSEGPPHSEWTPAERVPEREGPIFQGPHPSDVDFSPTPGHMPASSSAPPPPSSHAAVHQPPLREFPVSEDPNSRGPSRPRTAAVQLPPPPSDTDCPPDIPPKQSLQESLGSPIERGEPISPSLAYGTVLTSAELLRASQEGRLRDYKGQPLTVLPGKAPLQLVASKRGERPNALPGKRDAGTLEEKAQWRDGDYLQRLVRNVNQSPTGYDHPLYYNPKRGGTAIAKRYMGPKDIEALVYTQHADKEGNVDLDNFLRDIYCNPYVPELHRHRDGMEDGLRKLPPFAPETVEGAGRVHDEDGATKCMSEIANKLVLISKSKSKGQHFILICCIAVPYKPTTLFKELDEDHDGYLTRADLQRAAGRHRFAVTEHQLNALFTTLDKDGDGHVDPGKFCRRMPEINGTAFRDLLFTSPEIKLQPEDVPGEHPETLPEDHNVFMPATSCFRQSAPVISAPFDRNGLVVQHPHYTGTRIRPLVEYQRKEFSLEEQANPPPLDDEVASLNSEEIQKGLFGSSSRVNANVTKQSALALHTPTCALPDVPPPTDPHVTKASAAFGATRPFKTKSIFLACDDAEGAGGAPTSPLPPANAPDHPIFPQNTNEDPKVVSHPPPYFLRAASQPSLGEVESSMQMNATSLGFHRDRSNEGGVEGAGGEILDGMEGEGGAESDMNAKMSKSMSLFDFRKSAERLGGRRTEQVINWRGQRGDNVFAESLKEINRGRSDAILPDASVHVPFAAHTVGERFWPTRLNQKVPKKPRDGLVKAFVSPSAVIRGRVKREYTAMADEERAKMPPGRFDRTFYADTRGITQPAFCPSGRNSPIFANASERELVEDLTRKARFVSSSKAASTEGLGVTVDRLSPVTIDKQRKDAMRNTKSERLFIRRLEEDENRRWSEEQRHMLEQSRIAAKALQKLQYETRIRVKNQW
uniref:EF-hand domain-containing protein n=1 Tax=Chromera velia CCMP2878 TaxID=1169474 RepID=A0A0G4HHD0_9ALVE|eukprot:Cvel_27473.t1-p1 / transcript=Cvel_27473.t1 / gene=Cvel_27473 / organism=Chromera_velia_CCMP2878 / gene_product=hypothetical protein / transcript_product=hypothetical protein / location=Cvel_scaffold3431:6286-16952(-) / protein_length=1369 / sequence_SO=supercontig / SO=protein_coding / is_pseudo=false